MKTHYTIPFFIAHRGCPFTCVFCDQNRITGEDVIAPREVEERIEKYLSTMPREDVHVEVGFFGGTFTGLDAKLQKDYLGRAGKFLKDGRIHGIRLSTRPDYINAEVLGLLKECGVTCIELGVQSLSDSVLAAAKRGHTEEDVARASRVILEAGFTLGHQIMLGLPGSTWEAEYDTARRSVEMGATEMRIYPVIVIEGTELARMWRSGEYKPLEEDEALRRSSELIAYFNSRGVKVIRCGLHPSEGLLDGTAYLAGPFHPAFRQKAESLLFRQMLEKIAKDDKDIESLSFNPSDECALYGFEGSNTALIKKLSKRGCSLKKDARVPRGTLRIC